MEDMERTNLKNRDVGNDSHMAFSCLSNPSPTKTQADLGYNEARNFVHLSFGQQKEPQRGDFQICSLVTQYKAF